MKKWRNFGGRSLYIAANTDFMNMENVRSSVNLSKVGSADHDNIFKQHETSNSSGIFARKSFTSISYKSLTKLLRNLPSCSN